MGDKGRQDHQEGGHTIQQRETRRGTMGDKGRQDPREGRDTIQQRATRRGTVGDKGRQDPREGRHTMQQRQTRRGTMGDKTVGKGDTPSNTKADTLRKHQESPNSTLFGEKRKNTTSTDHSCGLHFVLSFSVCGNLDLSKVDSGDFRKAKLPAKSKHVQKNYKYSRSSQKFGPGASSSLKSTLPPVPGNTAGCPWQTSGVLAGIDLLLAIVEHHYVTVGGMKFEVTMKLPHF